VGDRVLFERWAGGLVLVRARAARTSWLARPDPSDSRRRPRASPRTSSSSSSVVAVRQPDLEAGFVDRVLLAAEEGGAAALVVVNKLD
jgi:putative ribosome biogenesis GTPase RsgA